MDLLTSVIFPYANFFMFLGLLVFLARKPLAAAMGAQRAEFEEAVKKVNSRKQEVESELSVIKARFESLDAELIKLKKDSTDYVEKECAKRLDQSAKYAAQTKEEAIRAASVEMDKAKRELKKELLAQAIAGVKETLCDPSNADSQDAIIRHNVSKLQGLSAGA